MPSRPPASDAALRDLQPSQDGLELVRGDPPQPPENLWRDRVLMWEASDPYLYARTTAEGRILIGGEDAETKDPDEREALMGAKREKLIDKMRELWPRADYAIDTMWGVSSAETDDGLPLIGRVPGAPRFFASYGYGGNGITFSYMASRMLIASFAGEGRDGSTILLWTATRSAENANSVARSRMIGALRLVHPGSARFDQSSSRSPVRAWRGP